MNIETAVVIFIFFVYSAADQSKLVTGSRRATTMENVRAIYNRFTRTSKGKATFYGEYPGGGLCSLDPPSPLASQNDWIKIAVSKEDFQKSLGCGMCVEIHGAGNPSTPDLKGTTPMNGVLKGMVYDLCGACKQGDIDLYLPGNGAWDITMKAIDCPSLTGTVGYIQFKFTGSNEWYFKLQPRNSKIPVAGVEVFNTVTSDWYCLKRTDDNYFTSEGLGKVTFPIKVRLTSITNEKLETTITTLKNDGAFPSDVQFSGIETRGGSPQGIQCFGQGHKSTKDTGPEVDEKFCAGKVDGKYADPVDCNAYYECSKGKSYKKYCEYGFKFNAMKGECDEARNVVCPNEKRNKLPRNRFVKSTEAESMEVRDISPRSLEDVTKKWQRSTILHKKRHHHHHYRNGLRAYKHHRHRHWGIKMTKKQRRKLHLKATATRIHQGFKRTSDKKLDVKVKVQFHGPNLSGEFVTKDPTNPKEGKLFVAAVESAEQGDEGDARLNGQNKKNGNDEVPALLKNTNTPVSLNAGVPTENPFKFEDDLQFDVAADKQQSNIAENVIVQASPTGDGTIQTSATVKPLLKSEGNAADGQVHGASNGGSSIPSVNNQPLLKGSYQTKPKVIYLKKEADKETRNRSSSKGISAALNGTQSLNAKKNMTSNQGIQPQILKGIMEAINFVKAIKLSSNVSNTPNTIANSSNKSIKHEQKDHRNTTKLINGGNSNEALMPSKLNVQNGEANLTHSGSKTKDNSQEMNQATKEKLKIAPNPKKQEHNFGILFIVNKTKNDNKTDQQVNPVIGSQVNIIPNINNKMKQITDKGDAKTGNTTASNKKKQDQSSDLITPATNVVKQSKQDRVVNKKTHQSVQKAGSVAGLLGIIGELVKSKVENKSSLLNETVDSGAAMTNGSQDKNGEHGKLAIGKINISLQAVTQGETQKNSDEGSSVTYNSTAFKQENNTNNDLSNQLQVLESPRPAQQGSSLKNNSAALAVKPNSLINPNQSESQTPMNVESRGNQGNIGSIQTKSVSIPLPVMRIRLKGPASKSLGAAQVLQDEILPPVTKHRGIFINNDDDESDHKGKSSHTTTVIIRQYNKDDKRENYGAEDTLPMAGSEDFDEYGNRKMAPPMISMNEANSLLGVDKTLLDNAAIHNVLFNPSLSNSYPEQKEGNMKTDQQGGLTGEAEDFAHALKHQEDEPNTLYKSAAKQAESNSHNVPSINSGDRFGSLHGTGVKGQHESVKPQGHVVSNYGSNQMGMEKHKNYMDELGDMPMGGNVGGMDQMQGMGGGMQDVPGMEERMHEMTGMGGGAQIMSGMGGKAQGMMGMGGGAQAMSGMGGRVQGMAGIVGGAQGLSGMTGEAPRMGGTGRGSGPMGMQVLGGSQDEINNNMNQALAGMQDMAMKQIQSKYPGMPITMKTDDGGDGSGEEPTVSVQQESGDNQEEAGSASSETSPSSHPTTSEVFGKHQGSKTYSEDKSEGKGTKTSNNKVQVKEQQSHDTSGQKPGNKNVDNDNKSNNHDGVKQSHKTEDREMHDATNDENEGNDEPVSSQNGENTKTATNGQEQSEPKDVCKQRASGVYTSNDDPSKFIICYDGITEERQCSNGMVFNPREKVCEALENQKENKLQDKPSKKKMKNQKISSTKSRKTRKASGKKSSSHEK